MSLPYTSKVVSKGCNLFYQKRSAYIEGRALLVSDESVIGELIHNEPQ